MLSFSKVNLELACRVLKVELDERIKHCFPVDDVLYKICSNYNEWMGTQHTRKFAEMIYDYGGKQGERTFYKELEDMLRPVKERDFFKDYNIDRYGGHHPTHPRLSYSLGTYYIYVHHSGETTYGTTYWVSENCENALRLAPIRKTLTPKLEVGKFYAVTLKKVKSFDRRKHPRGYWYYAKRKYFYKVDEIDEETYRRKGVLALRWTW